MITGIAHTGIVVEYLGKMVDFYRDVIGLTVTREKEVFAPPTGDHTGIPGAHKKLVFLGRPGHEHLLELICYLNPASSMGAPMDFNQINASHVCFNVVNLNNFYEDLRSKGVRFVASPKLRR